MSDGLLCILYEFNETNVSLERALAFREQLQLKNRAINYCYNAEADARYLDIEIISF